MKYTLDNSYTEKDFQRSLNFPDSLFVSSKITDY